MHIFLFRLRSHLETIKALGLRPRAFICFSVSGYPGQTLALVFDLLLEHTLIRLRVGLDQTCVELYSGNAFGGEVDPVFLRNLAIANERSDSMPSIDPVLHVCVTSKWLMQARH